jgi:hypothetical protein
MNANARPRRTRKATPTVIAMPALAPIERGPELNGVTVELGVDVWLTAAAVAAVVVVVEDEVDDDEAEVVDDEVEVVDDEVEVVDAEAEVVVGSELAVEE